MKRRFWTQEEHEVVRRNQANRVPLRVTAVQVNRSMPAVRSYASDNGLLQPRWERKDIAKALEMRANGHTSREIGLAVGKTPVNVRKLFWRRRKNGKV